jgi:L-amino acid N-acyltransferase YncA
MPSPLREIEGRYRLGVRDSEFGIVVGMIRAVDAERDSQRCAKIFAPYAAGPTAFVDKPPTADELRAAIERTTLTHPWLVAEDDGLVVGYAYASPHRSRPGYTFSTEVSAYVDAAWHGQGIGRALYTALLEKLREQGFHAVFAGVTLPNPALRCTKGWGSRRSVCSTRSAGRRVPGATSAGGSSFSCRDGRLR